MFVLGNFLIFIAQALRFISSYILQFLLVLIFIRALISWVSSDPSNPLVQFLNKVTEPVLYPIRRLMPLNFKIGIDFSPMVAALGIILVQYFINYFLIPTLFRLADKFG